MNKIFVFFLLFVLTLSLSAQPTSIKVLSYNIRCGYCEDSSDANNWSMRKYLVAYNIRTHNPDIIGLQEAEIFQVNDLAEMLDEYEWYAVSREDGNEKGESNAILYKKKRFELLTKQTLWLSKTPELVSKGWDAAFNRTLAVVKLKDLISSTELFYFNTHLDHKGEVARTEGSKLILNEVRKYSINYPVFLTGDFNYTSNSDGYRIITSKLYDAMIISKQKSIGGNITFNGFGKDIQPDNKIDFIFVNDKIEALNHLIDTTTFNGMYPSDHYPVIAEITLK